MQNLIARKQTKQKKKQPNFSKILGLLEKRQTNIFLGLMMLVLANFQFQHCKRCTYDSEVTHTAQKKNIKCDEILHNCSCMTFLTY